MSDLMRECGRQCRVTIKDLWAQWVQVMNHNYQSQAACRSMPFIWQLDKNLRDPGKPCLLVPASWLSKEEDSLWEDPLGHQHQVLA